MSGPENRPWSARSLWELTDEEFEAEARLRGMTVDQLLEEEAAELLGDEEPAEEPARLAYEEPARLAAK